MFTLSPRSEKRLEGVHADLVKVVRRALEVSECDFGVVEGLRSQERQAELLASGKSKTIHSRHLTGHAVDLVPFVGGEAKWEFEYFKPISRAMLAASKELLIPIVWGGNWTFRDGPHFELAWSSYPVKLT